MIGQREALTAGWLSTAPFQAEIDDVESVLDATTLFGVVTTLVGAYILARLLAFVLSASAERSPSRRITIKMFQPVVKLLIYGIAVYIVVVPLFEVTSAQLFALSGLIGAALGFGLQDLVSALFAGFVIVTERPYQVGDKITLDDNYGEVTDIGLRATKLETPDDTTVVIPNDAIFGSSVANANDGRPEMMVTVDLAVSPDAPEASAAAILEDALVTSPYVYVDENHPAFVRVSDQVSYRRIRGRAYVADLRDEHLFASDVTVRTLEAFETAGIETPQSPVLHRADEL